jgi:hypothetical protein
MMVERRVARRLAVAAVGPLAAAVLTWAPGPAGATGPSDGAVGCGTGEPSVTLDFWALYGKQAPLVGDPSWGETIRTHVLPSALAPGRYHVFGVSEDNLSAAGQEHEQWAVEIGESRSAFTPDIPDDAVWYAQTPGPDDDGDLATTPAWVEDQLPGSDLGFVDVADPADAITLVHIEHDGQLEPWSPNSVNYRFATLACVPPAPTTTAPPTTAASTTAASTTAAPTTAAPTTAAPTTVAPTSVATESPTTVSESAVSPEAVEAPEAGLAFTGADVATLAVVGLVLVAAGVALVRVRRGSRPA